MNNDTELVEFYKFLSERAIIDDCCRGEGEAECAVKLYNKSKVKNLDIQRVIHWVAVADNLPPKDTLVLAYYPEGNENGREVDTTTYYGGKLTDTGSSVSYCFEATHWAELPEPPCV